MFELFDQQISFKDLLLIYAAVVSTISLWWNYRQRVLLYRGNIKPSLILLEDLRETLKTSLIVTLVNYGIDSRIITEINFRGIGDRESSWFSQFYDLVFWRFAHLAYLPSITSNDQRYPLKIERGEIVEISIGPEYLKKLAKFHYIRIVVYDSLGRRYYLDRNYDTSSIRTSLRTKSLIK